MQPAIRLNGPAETCQFGVNDAVYVFIKKLMFIYLFCVHVYESTEY